MNDPLRDAIRTLLDGANLTAEQMQSAIGTVMDGGASEAQIAALLTALRLKGETVPEIVGAAQAMIERCTPVTCQSTALLDTCGTGGDALQTFNISTATALLVAAAGVPVAKHGNRSVSSSSGSADVLTALDVNIDLTPEQVGRCIDEVGIGFCFAPLVHGAMKHAAPVRKQLGFRTIFNLLGPLTNPAGADFQLLGANAITTAGMLAEALVQLRRPRAVVVCGNGELDEVSLWGETTAWIVEDGTLRQETWTAESFGLPACRVEQLQVTSPAESAARIRSVLDGQPGPARDIVVANAAAALWIAEKTETVSEGASTAAEVLDAGEAAGLLNRFGRFTQAFAA